MATFAKRATPRQTKVLHIIHGAVRNAAHAHPDWNMPERFANSVAKRAAGTLVAAWPSVLATPHVVARSSDLLREQGKSPSATAAILLPPARSEPTASGGAAHLRSRAPIRQLHGRLGVMAGDAKRGGDYRRHEVLVEILRLIATEYAR